MSGAAMAAPSSSAREESEGLAVFANALRLVLGLDPLYQDGRDRRYRTRAEVDAERFYVPSQPWPNEVR